MRIIAAHLAKLLEDRRLFSERNTDTGVTDRDLRTTFCLIGGDADSPSFGGELHGVGKKIEKNLFDLALIPDVFPKPLVNIEIQGNPVLDGPLAYKCPCVVDCQWEIKRF